MTISKPFTRLLGLATGAYATRRSITGGPGHRGPPSGHFDGEVFRNLDPRSTAGRTLADFRRWQRMSRATPWPRRVENRAVPDPPNSLASREIAITFVKHITYLVQLRGLNVLTDPVYCERVSPVQWSGPRRVRDPGLAFEALPRVDTVLVSHSHYDHLDLDTLQRLEREHSPLFLTGLGNQAFLEEHGLRHVRELDWWESIEHDGHRYTYTPAQHWSGRALSGRNRTLWGGSMSRACRSVPTHHAGSCRTCMNPDDAVRAHLDLEATLSIGTHYGCFQPTDEGIDEPVRELGIARVTHGVDPRDFRALETGETLRIGA